MGETLVMLVMGFLCAKALLMGRAVSAVAQWAMLPLVDAVFAYIATVRGINNYLAWIPAPFTVVAGHYLAFFYLPASAGPALLCAFCAVLGAATGDVVKKSRENGGKKR